MLNDNEQPFKKTSLSLFKKDLLSTAKKTERLVTAIYMVTNLMSDTEPLSKSIRETSVVLLSDIFATLEADVVYKGQMFTQSLATIEQLMSSLEIVRNLRFVSDMNVNILQSELMKLQNIIRQEIHAVTDHDTLLRDMFENNKIETLETLQNDTLKNVIESPVLSSQNDIAVPLQKNIKRQNLSDKASSSKRHEKILAVIKEKKKVTMKDLATRITNCTEKTLQRDLTTLIKKGHIEKQGSKRWSTYVFKK